MYATELPGTFTYTQARQVALSKRALYELRDSGQIQVRCHPETRAYEIRRSAEGKTHRDIRRSVKRALARRLYRTIEAAPQLHQEVTLAA